MRASLTIWYILGSTSVHYKYTIQSLGPFLVLCYLRRKLGPLTTIERGASGHAKLYYYCCIIPAFSKTGKKMYSPKPVKQLVQIPCCLIFYPVILSPIASAYMYYKKPWNKVIEHSFSVSLFLKLSSFGLPAWVRIDKTTTTFSKCTVFSSSKNCYVIDGGKTSSRFRANKLVSSMRLI